MKWQEAAWAAIRAFLLKCVPTRPGSMMTIAEPAAILSSGRAKSVVKGFAGTLISVFIALMPIGCAVSTIAVDDPLFTASGQASGLSAASALYGSSLAFDVLSNMPLAQGDVDYRFRASESGFVRGLLWYDIYKRGGSSPGCTGTQCECDGYGCGTGGAIEICIYPDDGTQNHLPTDLLTQGSTGLQAAPLACVLSDNPRSGQFLRAETFATAPWLESGVLYHLHWHNADPDPVHNFISVDDVCVWHPSPQRQPAYSNLDLAVLSIYNNGKAVVAEELATDTPIFQLSYEDGKYQGQGYIDTWNDAPITISGKQEVREQFRVGGMGRSVSGIAVRVNRVQGTGALTIILATLEGNIMESGEIAASTFPIGPPLTNNAAASANVNPAWGSYAFGASHELNEGAEYQLILSTPAGTVYQAYGIERGDVDGFRAPTIFSDGYGQFSVNGGATWTGFTQPDGTSGGNTNRTNGDLQFYFVTE
jgi:hypothetical protein